MAGVEPATSSLPRMRSTTELHQQRETHSLRLDKYERINKNRAENGAQTRDPQLGRLVLYRLSYFRKLPYFRPTPSTSGRNKSQPCHRKDIYNKVKICGCGWIRTTEVERQQIYSLPHLAALEHTQYFSHLIRSL